MKFILLTYLTLLCFQLIGQPTKFWTEHYEINFDIFEKNNFNNINIQSIGRAYSDNNIRKGQSDCEFQMFCVNKDSLNNKIIIDLSEQTDIAQVMGFEVSWTKVSDTMNLWVSYQYFDDFILKDFYFKKGTYFINDLNNNFIKKKMINKKDEHTCRSMPLKSKWLITVTDWDSLKTNKSLEELIIKKY